MFTGIIEALGVVKGLEREGSNLHLEVESAVSCELKIDQSISHNGVCLTVTKLDGDKHWVTAVDETLKKSNLGDVQVGDKLNLERCIVMNGRLDGHIVQGHVDGLGEVLSINEKDGSWVLTFRYDRNRERIVVEKGSICLNGVSLTVFDVQPDRFSVTIIPYTWEHTNLGALKVGDKVNLEFDIIGKYVAALADLDQYKQG